MSKTSLKNYIDEYNCNPSIKDELTIFACQVAKPLCLEIKRLRDIYMESHNDILFNIIKNKICNNNIDICYDVYNISTRLINWYIKEIKNYGDPRDASWLGLSCASVRLFRDSFEDKDKYIDILYTLTDIWRNCVFNNEQHECPFIWEDVVDIDPEIDICKGIWKNPFETNEEYEKYIRKDPKKISKLASLKGKSIGCFCIPKKNHHIVLIKLYKEFNIEYKWQ